MRFDKEALGRRQANSSIWSAVGRRPLCWGTTTDHFTTLSINTELSYLEISIHVLIILISVSCVLEYLRDSNQLSGFKAERMITN